MIQSIQHHLWNSVMARVCMASSGTGLLVFIDDVTENRSSLGIYCLPRFSQMQCNKVRRKEGSGQGWLVKTQVCLFKTDKLTQVRTLRHPETSTLSFVSAITLCIRSDCFSLTARAPESSLRLSPWTAVPRRLLFGLHANYCNQTQVILILHLTHLLTAVSWVFLPLQTSLNHAPLATYPHRLTQAGKPSGQRVNSRPRR